MLCRNPTEAIARDQAVLSASRSNQPEQIEQTGQRTPGNVFAPTGLLIKTGLMVIVHIQLVAELRSCQRCRAGWPDKAFH